MNIEKAYSYFNSDNIEWNRFGAFLFQRYIYEMMLLKDDSEDQRGFLNVDNFTAFQVFENLGPMMLRTPDLTVCVRIY
ncbi:MAG: hypothetical protein MJ252_20145 [archaeon]|nr:hypothetical protein [archaeon]